MEKILYAQLMVMNILVLAVVWQNDIYRSRGPLLLSQKIFRIIIGINIGAMAKQQWTTTSINIVLPYYCQNQNIHYH